MREAAPLAIAQVLRVVTDDAVSVVAGQTEQGDDGAADDGAALLVYVGAHGAQHGDLRSIFLPKKCLVWGGYVALFQGEIFSGLWRIVLGAMLMRMAKFGYRSAPSD